MTDSELLDYMGTDAIRWAEKFDDFMREDPDKVLEPGVMIGWFANAIQAGYDEARGIFEQKANTEVNVFDDNVPDWNDQFIKLHEFEEKD
ncbi:MAG: hypothetical protein ABWY25_09605 [Paenisporosarcina sp.]